jgi:hypothetical protein
MALTLETMSWIAGIVAVPVAVVLAAIGWLKSGKQKTNKSTVRKGGTAISGDLRVNEASIVVGHNSPVSVSLTVNKDTENADSYERRYAIFQAVGKALNEALCDKMISDETFQSFSKAVTDSRFLLGDKGLVAYLNEVRKRAAQFQANTVSLEALPVGDERGRASAAAGEHRIWLINQIDGLSRKFEPVLSGLIEGPPYAKSAPPAPIPDMPIHDLFFHIRPDLLENAPEKRWEGVARDVMDNARRHN